jgi:NAD(P)-dependent dehydrogenase (short-subunit alcohol dehydrogenase family)
MGKLGKKVAIVTGGASGFGEATSILFAEEGAFVVVVADFNVEGGKAVVDRIRKAGGNAIYTVQQRRDSRTKEHLY